MARASDLGNRSVIGINEENANEVKSPLTNSAVEHASYREMQRRMTNHHIQGLYTYAINMPCYQGLILFFLGASYPFMCLILRMVLGKKLGHRVCNSLSFQQTALEYASECGFSSAEQRRQ
jgi:hypothetical protein